MDPLSGKAIVTDICLKRRIRDYFLVVKQGPGEHIIRRNSFDFDDSQLQDAQSVLLADCGLTEDQLVALPPKRKKAILSDRFIDHRLFGSMHYMGKKLYAVTGPVQFEIAKSLNNPRIFETTISSTMAGRKETGAGTLGKSNFLDYALFVVHGLVKRSLAVESGMSPDDIPRLYEGLWNGTKFQRTRTKFNQLPRLLLGIILKDARKQLPSIRRSISIPSTVSNTDLIGNLVLDINNLVDYIKRQSPAIRAIEIKEDPGICYRYKDTDYANFTEIPDIQSNFPEIVPINF